MIRVGMKVVGIQKITYPAFKADNEFFFYNNHHLHSPYETQKKVHIFYCLYLHVHPSLNNPIYDVFKKWTKERGFSIKLFIHWQVVLLDCVHFSLISLCEQATLGKGKNYQVNVNILIVIFRSKFDIFFKEKKSQHALLLNCFFTTHSELEIKDVGLLVETWHHKEPFLFESADYKKVWTLIWCRFGIRQRISMEIKTVTHSSTDLSYTKVITRYLKS